MSITSDDTAAGVRGGAAVAGTPVAAIADPRPVTPGGREADTVVDAAADPRASDAAPDPDTARHVARSGRRSARWRWATGVATGVAVVVLIRQVQGIDFARLFSDAAVGHVGEAVLVSLVPLLGAAAALLVLSPVRLPMRATVAAQTATSFANLVTPAGAGGLALLTRFVQLRRVPTARAVATVALVQATSVLSTMIAVAVAVLAAGRRIDLADRLPAPVVGLATLAAAAAVALLVWIAARGRNPLLVHALGSVRETVRQTGHVLLRQPARVLGGIVAGLLVLFGSALTLSACVSAYGAEAPLSSVVLVLSIGTAIGTATPVPGGIGAFETSLAAGLVVAGVDPLAALFAAVMYRLLTFWFRVPLGWCCLMWLRHTGHV